MAETKQNETLHCCRLHLSANCWSGRDDTQMVSYEHLGRDALLAAPTPEHYLPLLYVIGLRRDGDRVSFPVEGFDGGSISMLSVRIG